MMHQGLVAHGLTIYDKAVCSSSYWWLGFLVTLNTECSHIFLYVIFHMELLKIVDKTAPLYKLGYLGADQLGDPSHIPQNEIGKCDSQLACY